MTERSKTPAPSRGFDIWDLFDLPYLKTESQRMLGGLWKWIRAQPVAALLLAASGAIAFYHLGLNRLFLNNRQSALAWEKSGWNGENDQEHGFLVYPIFFALLLYHRSDFRKRAGAGDWRGLLLVIIGVGFYFISARMVEPRYALAGIVPLLCGVTAFLWGAGAGRVMLFPALFTLFAVPMGAITQSTNSLQIVTTRIVGSLCGLIGAHVRTEGTQLISLDGAFHFEVAGGCSGIRSLMAMAMLAALYVHLTQREMWKKIIIFGVSFLFAIIGNICRIFSVVLVAKLTNSEVAETYHDWSGFVFFPCAFIAMFGFTKLLNNLFSPERVEKVKRAAVAKVTPVEGAAAKAEESEYDY